MLRHLGHKLCRCLWNSARSNAILLNLAPRLSHLEQNLGQYPGTLHVAVLQGFLAVYVMSATVSNHLLTSSCAEEVSARNTSKSANNPESTPKCQGAMLKRVAEAWLSTWHKCGFMCACTIFFMDGFATSKEHIRRIPGGYLCSRK